MKLYIFVAFVTVATLAFQLGLSNAIVITVVEEKEILKREIVAIKEVDIPYVYDAGKLNTYCKYEWMPLWGSTS